MVVMRGEVVTLQVEQLLNENEYGDTIRKLKRGAQVSPYWTENDKLWMTSTDDKVQAVVSQAHDSGSA
ncbi:unnamed protein product [Gongylonema pulchrum]|uniref:Transposase n=1 Tax=Gongylonema pulchrum TaxID=637853 RepID=A0A183DXT0_9BILA|nr:unnamed protein product [Gongylonema pulchrum]